VRRLINAACADWYVPTREGDHRHRL